MKTNDFQKGMVVWIPCEVRGGPFPDERRVYVSSELGDWFGFVNISELEKKIREGKDRVRGVVLAVEKDRVVVAINGQSPASKMLRAEPSSIQHGAF